MNKLITIPFHHQTITAIDHDGKPYIAMRPIVENLGLDWGSQSVKINEKFSSTVAIIATVAEDGKQREMLCLPLTKLAGFLYSINPTKVSPKYRDLIITYQNEADEVLFNHFMARYQQGETEHNALLAALFARHPQWQDTLERTRQGQPTSVVAKLQGEVCMFTSDQLLHAKNNIHKSGKTIKEWADENNFPERPVYLLLCGVLKGRNGTAHEIAVRLGLKPTTYKSN